VSHYNQLRAAFNEEWRLATKPPALTRAELYDDNTRFWICEDTDGRNIINWECRKFPGCDTLIITTKVELREDLRGMGLGRFFRELRHRAYRRAGFVGELATVRTDNARQNALMASMGGVAMGEFRSDFGGTYKLWLTNLLTVAERGAHSPSVDRQPPSRVGLATARVRVEPLAHPTTLGDVWIGETLPDLLPEPDAPVVTPPIVTPRLDAEVLTVRHSTPREAAAAQGKRWSHRGGA
jgi:hypothetical protein